MIIIQFIIDYCLLSGIAECVRVNNNSTTLYYRFAKTNLVFLFIYFMYLLC